MPSNPCALCCPPPLTVCCTALHCTAPHRTVVFGVVGVAHSAQLLPPWPLCPHLQGHPLHLPQAQPLPCPSQAHRQALPHHPGSPRHRRFHWLVVPQAPRLPRTRPPHTTQVVVVPRMWRRRGRRSFRLVASRRHPQSCPHHPPMVVVVDPTHPLLFPPRPQHSLLSPGLHDTPHADPHQGCASPARRNRRNTRAVTASSPWNRSKSKNLLLPPLCHALHPQHSPPCPASQVRQALW